MISFRGGKVSVWLGSLLTLQSLRLRNRDYVDFHRNFREGLRTIHKFLHPHNVLVLETIEGYSSIKNQIVGFYAAIQTSDIV